MQEVTEDRSLLHDLFEQHGSPINLHYLDAFVENYQAYTKILDRHKLKHNIFFARKANTCRAFPKEAQRLGFGVDTAGYRELKQCLELGCSPDSIILTAAVKNERLVRLALANDVVMMLDNEDECRLVHRMAQELGKTPEIGIRISGFQFEGQKLYSRFGFDVETVADFISQRLGAGNECDTLRFTGFHFHLDGYSVSQRSEALIQTLQLTDELEHKGISTSFIDMGGGLLINYLSDNAEWEAFWVELRKAIRGDRKRITFSNNGLGYKIIEGKLRGTPEVYPFYNEMPKEQFLEAVLSYKNGEGKTVAALLHEREIEFRMEPGRSLLDQTGMTIAKVAYRKKDQRGDWLVGLEMNRSQLSSSSADFLLDPIFISMQPAEAQEKPTAVYLTGAYCLEQDIILKRKIVVPHLPQIGDAVAFPNTAGYMMHFYETRSHLFDFATNLVGDSDSFPHFTPDANLK